jgi:Na+-transporting NADH:ubiquinone oxidoreductase subunit D
MRFNRQLLARLVDDNPITVQILGLCSALAVSRSLKPALIMAVAVIAVLTFSNLAVSALRNVMPRSIRLILEVTLIASAVIVVDEVLKAFVPDIAAVLTVFVGLIITNCIVLGRAESFAVNNGMADSFVDALVNGTGYATILLLIAAFREFFGAGTLFGIRVLPGSYPDNDLMSYAPSAFFLLALVVWVLRSLRPSQVEESEPVIGACEPREVRR